MPARERIGEVLADLDDHGLTGCERGPDSVRAGTRLVVEEPRCQLEKAAVLEIGVVGRIDAEQRCA